MAFSPLSRGTLTSVIRSLDELAPEDARRGLPRFQAVAFAANRRLVVRGRGCRMGARGDGRSGYARVSAVEKVCGADSGVAEEGAVGRERGATEIEVSEDEPMRLADAVPLEGRGIGLMRAR